MATVLQVEANRANAVQSTGPKTPKGRARSAQNALRHGLRSEAPVLPGESAEDWQGHLAGIAQSLAPAGALEVELAGRVALSLWRLRRVAAFEAAVTAAGLEEVAQAVRQEAARALVMPGEEQPEAVRLRKTREALEQKRTTLRLWEGSLALLKGLADLLDHEPVCGHDLYGALEDVSGELPDAEDSSFDVEDEDFLAGLGVPADERNAPWDWEGWTAGLARRAVATMAKQSRANPEKVLGRALRERERIQAEGRQECRRLQREAAQLERQVRAQQERTRQRRMLPDAPTLDKVMRYEAHVSRQMLQALHTLERLQAARAGEPVPPPAALDVTVNGAALPGCTPGSDA
jgi:hypothetical protein